jgi:tRNA pseudouridine38-40 synthase
LKGVLIFYSMRKIRLLLEYDGTAYYGWQIQAEGLTVQGILEDSVLRITGERSRVTGASRTDAGVHALGQVAVFRTGSGLEPAVIKRALNAVLPRDIRVLETSVAEDSFRPRDDALEKSYFYLIVYCGESSAFLHHYTWHVPRKLDLSAMLRAADCLIGRHDFSSFMGKGCGTKDPIREIFSLRIEELEKIDFMTTGLKGRFLKITMAADGFLRHMVRNIVGTIVETGRGRISSDEMKEILRSRDRKRAGRTAPPNALFLEKIRY